MVQPCVGHPLGVGGLGIPGQVKVTQLLSGVLVIIPRCVQEVVILGVQVLFPRLSLEEDLAS